MPENSLLNWNTNKNFWDKSAEDIGGSFGLPEKYTKFIDKYDPFQENVANKQFSTGMSGLRKEGGQSLFEMLKSGRETTAKSGFAGSGAVSRDIDSTRKQLMERFGTQSEGMRTDRYGSIMGARKDYEKSIYDMMGTLAQSGVKFDGGGDGGGYNYPSNPEKDEWFTSSKDSSVWQWDGTTWVWRGGPSSSKPKTESDYTLPTSSQEGNAEYNFPPNPVPNQTFTASNGTTYIFDDVDGWKVSTSQESPGTTQPGTVKEPTFTGGSLGSRLGP